MTRGRAFPPPTPSRAEQEHAERRAALLSLEPAQVRDWARRWNVPLITTNDDGLLVSMHEAIARDMQLPPDAIQRSLRWLAARGDAVAVAALAELERQSRGPEMQDAAQGNAEPTDP